MATTARTVTTRIRKALRDAGLLDNVVKVNTSADRTSALGEVRDTWTTTIETVTKDGAHAVVAALATNFPHVKPACGVNFFTAQVIQPRDEDDSTTGTALEQAADPVEQVAAPIAPSVTAEAEAAEQVKQVRPLLALATRPLPGRAEWDAGLPGAEAKVGDTVLLHVDDRAGFAARYARVAEVEPGPDGGLVVTWISPSSLKRWAGRVRPELFADDYAEMIAQDARHRVLGAWALADRFAKLTEEERNDPEELRDYLGAMLPKGADPVWFVRSTLADHARTVAEYGTREAHAQAAHDHAYRIALPEQCLVSAFPRHPQVVHVPRHRTHVTRANVRVVATVTP